MRGKALIVGGGFYGCCLAVFLRRHFEEVILIEREASLLMRASRVNQARLHYGYHYPRSFLTAARSRANFEGFRAHFPGVAFDSFRHLYCIARTDSKVGARYFERFCSAVDLPLTPAPSDLSNLFTRRLIDRVYEVPEPAFDVDALRRNLVGQLADSDIVLRTGETVERIASAGDAGASRVELASGEALVADWVFNCTYASINRLSAATPASRPMLKHQFTEVALIEPPDALRELAVTVMDGPFFSIMPFPAEGLYSLTHVRYTPHLTWIESEQPEIDPIEVLERFKRTSRYPWMIRDAQRYLPILAEAKHVKSLFEIKTVTTGSEVDDSRPIVVHRDASNSQVVSILGGKIDNIFDIYEVVGGLLLDQP